MVDWKYLLEKENPILTNESDWLKRQGLTLMVDFSSGIILNNPEEFEKNISLLKGMKVRIYLIAAPEKDIYGTLWNINKPVNSFSNKKALKPLLQTSPESALIMDGLYNGRDAEYSDIHTIETL